MSEIENKIRRLEKEQISRQTRRKTRRKRVSDPIEKDTLGRKSAEKYEDELRKAERSLNDLLQYIHEQEIERQNHTYETIEDPKEREYEDLESFYEQKEENPYDTIDSDYDSELEEIDEGIGGSILSRSSSSRTSLSSRTPGQENTLHEGIKIAIAVCRNSKKTPDFSSQIEILLQDRDSELPEEFRQRDLTAALKQKDHFGNTPLDLLYREINDKFSPASSSYSIFCQNANAFIDKFFNGQGGIGNLDASDKKDFISSEIYEKFQENQKKLAKTVKNQPEKAKGMAAIQKEQILATARSLKSIATSAESLLKQQESAYEEVGRRLKPRFSSDFQISESGYAQKKQNPPTSPRKVKVLRINRTPIGQRIKQQKSMQAIPEETNYVDFGTTGTATPPPLFKKPPPSPSQKRVSRAVINAEKEIEKQEQAAKTPPTPPRKSLAARIFDRIRKFAAKLFGRNNQNRVEPASDQSQTDSFTQEDPQDTEKSTPSFAQVATTAMNVEKFAKNASLVGTFAGVENLTEKAEQAGVPLEEFAKLSQSNSSLDSISNSGEESILSGVASNLSSANNSQELGSKKVMHGTVSEARMRGNSILKDRPSITRDDIFLPSKTSQTEVPTRKIAPLPKKIDEDLKPKWTKKIELRRQESQIKGDESRC